MTESDTQAITLSEDDIDEWFDSEEMDGPEHKLSDEELSQKYSDTQVRIVRTSLDFTLHTLASSIKDKSYLSLLQGGILVLCSLYPLSCIVLHYLLLS